MKNKRKIFIGLGILLILALAELLIFKLTTPEDFWQCREGQWLRHGNPSAPMPLYECGSFKTKGGVVENADWQAVKAAIQNCEADLVMQAHSLEVRVELKDGRILTATEPAIDDIIDIAVSAREKCGDFPIATE